MNDVMNSVMNRKTLFLLGPVAGLVMFAGRSGWSRWC